MCHRGLAGLVLLTVVAEGALLDSLALRAAEQAAVAHDILIMLPKGLAEEMPPRYLPTKYRSCVAKGRAAGIAGTLLPDWAIGPGGKPLLW